MNFKFLRILICFLYIGFFGITNVNAQKNEQPKPFPLKAIFPGDEKWLQSGVTIHKSLKVGTSGAILEWQSDEFTLRGKNKAGKNWKVTFDAVIGYEAYEADFDKNGVKDFLFVCDTSSNGFLPSRIFQFVLFDKQGRPVPFFIPANDDIKNIVDLNKNGRAEFRFWHYNYGADGNKWSGYYITDIYEANNTRWEKLNSIKGRKLPIFTSFDFAKEGNKFLPASEKLVKNQDKFSPNYANDKSLSKSKSFPYLSVENSAYCYFQKTLRILDSNEGRQISFIDLDEEKAAQNLLKNASRVELYGQCQPDKVSPYMVWIVK